jgi:plasmid stability protein
MPVDLSIKRVPDKLAKRLRERAAHNHRSLQGELMAILHEAVGDGSNAGASRAAVPARQDGSLDARSSGWIIAPRSESALMIREDREGCMFTIRDLHEYVSGLGQGTPDESTDWIREERRSR